MEKSKEKAICWTPTKAEIKLLDVLIDPNNRFLTVDEMCKKAKVCRDIHYRAFKKPEFCEYYNKLSHTILARSVAPIYNSMAREAVRGSHPHQKTCLEMLGLYTEKLEVNEESYGDRIKRIRARLGKTS